MADPKETWAQWLAQTEGGEKLLLLSPAQSARPWDPTPEDREAAWALYTQIRTRISTQPLHYRAGDEEAALDSLYRLFDLTRRIIEDKGPACGHLATIAIEVLNRHIRPLTAKWHKKKIDGRIRHDDDRRNFRRELGALQPRLATFCNLLGRFAEGDDFLDGDQAQTEDQAATADDKPTPFEKILLDKDVPGRKEMFEAEHAAIRARRGEGEKIENLAGLACSGGGIRSATFCLGAAQALAKKGLLPRIDYISTVSGGGYFGAFLSSYLNDKDQKVGLEPGRLPFDEEGRAEPEPIRRLRNNSKYLLKGGLIGQSRVIGLFVFGTLVNLFTLLPVLFGALALTKLLELFLGLTETRVYEFVGYALVALLIVQVVLALCLPVVYRYWASHPARIAGYEKLALTIGLLLIATWLLGWVLPWVYDTLRAFSMSKRAVFVLFAVLPFIFAVAAFNVGMKTMAGRLLLALAGLAGPLLLAMSYIVLNDVLYAGWLTILGPLALAVLLIGWLNLIDVNQISPHRYYRNRLAETYLLRRGKDKAVDPQALSALRSNNPSAPYHLINAAVNLPSSKDPELRGRSADFFLFSQHYCGSPLVGYCKTEALEKKDPDLDLGTAMAISGAAASAYMGSLTIKGLSFWLSLLNMRLAYWLPNPKRLDAITDGAGARPFSLWWELFGDIDENKTYLNLSDGGHIENLGIYELLRRRCKYIVAIDGEADVSLSFPSLMQLIRYARIDFGIDIRIDLGDFETNDAGFAKAHAALGEIDYGDGATGYLLYVKSSLTGNERDYVRDYRANNPTFPHETTADQFFSEAQFEAYRELGNHIVDDLFHTDVVDGRDRMTLESWFDALVRNLLPR